MKPDPSPKFDRCALKFRPSLKGRVEGHLEFGRAEGVLQRQLQIEIRIMTNPKVG